MFAPTQETIDSVKTWLVKSGIPADKITLSKSKGWLSFETTVSKLQSLVKADYHLYKNVQSRDEHMGTDEYSLPSEVAPFVDFLLPGTSFGKVAKRDGKKDTANAIKEPFVALSKDDAAQLKAQLSRCHKSEYNPFSILRALTIDSCRWYC